MALCHTLQVNRKLLLEDLYDSRQCNRLLETETAEEAWTTSSIGDERAMGRQNSQFEVADAYDAYEVRVTFVQSNVMEIITMI